MKTGENEQLDELRTNRRQLERQLSRDHAEINKLAIVNDPSGATSARIADLHVRITKSKAELIRVVSSLEELERHATKHGDIAETLLNFDLIWETLTNRERCRLIRLLVARVEFNAKDTSISVSFYPGAIRSLPTERKDEAA